MSQEPQEILEQAIQALLDENKTPTVALVKQRLSTPLPMALIINRLQRLKQEGSLAKGRMPSEKKPEQITADDKIAALEAKVNLLTTRLEALEAQLEK